MTLLNRSIWIRYHLKRLSHHHLGPLVTAYGNHFPSRHSNSLVNPYYFFFLSFFNILFFIVLNSIFMSLIPFNETLKELRFALILHLFKVGVTLITVSFVAKVLEQMIPL